MVEVPVVIHNWINTLKTEKDQNVRHRAYLIARETIRLLEKPIEQYERDIAKR